MNLDQLLDRDDLYYTAFPEGWSFTYRLLTLKEYRRFNALRAAGQFHRYYLYWKVFERCYDGDVNLLNQYMPMGVPISMGELIMYLSGDCEAETVRVDIQIARNEYGGGDLTEKLKRIILIAFPSYLPEQLDHMNRNALIRLMVQAEELLKDRYGKDYKPLDISKIVTASEQVDEAPENINFDVENEAIKRHVHPFDEIDRIEEEYKLKKKSKVTTLTPEQLSKLDRLQGR